VIKTDFGIKNHGITLYYKFEERRRPNELNSKAELDALSEIIKQVNYPDSNPVYRDIHNYDKKMIGIIIENIKDIRIFNGDNRT